MEVVNNFNKNIDKNGNNLMDDNEQNNDKNANHILNDNDHIKSTTNSLICQR